MRFVCSRQKEVKEALNSGHWPNACAADLRSHVNACSLCSELVLVTQAFQRVRCEAANAAPLASPGLLWWRAQLRRRNSAVERVAKPVAIAHAFALLLTLVVAVGFAISQWQYGAQWVSWVSELPRSSAFHLPTFESFVSALRDSDLLLSVPICGMLAIFSGLAVYLAFERQ